MRRFQLPGVLVALAALSLLACGGTPPAEAPATPTGLTATGSDGAVALGWNANAEENLKGYNIHWGSSEGSLDQSVQVLAPGTGHTLTGLSNGTSYYFALEAESQSGQKSGRTAVVSATPFAVTDSAPILLATVPADGATAVPVSTSLSIQFSKAIDTSSLSVSINPSVALGSPTFGADNLEVTYLSVTLTPSTSYTVTVSAKDLAGRELAGATSFSFTSGGALDTTPPTLLTSVPANNASDVAVSQSLTLTFSEPMDQGSVTVDETNGFDFGIPTWTDDDKVATFEAAPSQFSSGTSYEVSITGSDRAGNGMTATVISFTTAEPPDVTAPTVVNSAPAANATGISTNTSISVTFSEGMNKASVDGAFSISPNVAGTVLWDGTDSLRSFQPSAALAASTQYTITIGTGAQDKAGNALAAPFSFSFTTAAAPDTTAPTITASAPAASATGAARNANIIVTFSEPMDQAAAQAAFAITNPASHNTGTFSWNAGGTVMTFNPANDFTYAQSVSWRVSTGAKDLAGNAMAAQLTRSFTVIREGTMVIDAVAGLDGYITSGSTVNTAGSLIIVGDSSTNLFYRGFLTFDLSALPSNLTFIKTAIVYVFHNSYQGDPYGALGGGLRMERVDYGATLDSTDFEKAPFALSLDAFSLSNSTTQGWKSSSVIVAGLVRDWSDRVNRSNHTQWRMKFPNNLASNSANDYVTWYSANSSATTCTRPHSAATGSSCKPHLVVNYEYP